MLESRADSRANRERVLEAAKAVFAQKGLGAEVKEIAEQAGVGVGTIYRHFPSKADLLTALALEAAQRFSEAFDEAEDVSDPTEALAMLLRRVFDRIADHGWLVEATLSGDFSPERSAEIRDGMKSQRFLERMEQIIRRGVAETRFRPDLDVGVSAAMLLGTMVPWNYRILSAGRTPEQVAGAVMQLFMNGAHS